MRSHEWFDERHRTVLIQILSRVLAVHCFWLHDLWNAGVAHLSTLDESCPNPLSGFMCARTFTHFFKINVIICILVFCLQFVQFVYVLPQDWHKFKDMISLVLVLEPTSFVLSHIGTRAESFLLILNSLFLSLNLWYTNCKNHTSFCSVFLRFLYHLSFLLCGVF